MNRSKKLLEVIRPLLNDEMPLSNELYGRVMRMYSPACKCPAKVTKVNYADLCKLSKKNGYTITIIQDGKILSRELNNNFFGAYQHISACYQMDPFDEALVIARDDCKRNSFRVFWYKPDIFEEAIILPNISCFKYLIEHFNVYKSDGSLAQSLDELKGETEVVAFSKQGLAYDYHGEQYTMRIILRWYQGYF